MATQWPKIVAGLVALLPTLPDWSGVGVFDGAAYDIPSTMSSFVTVGHATDGVSTHGGSFSTMLSLDGFQYVEQGSVACQLVCTADGPDITAVRALIFKLIDDLDAAIRADRTLGVLSKEGTFDLTVDVESIQAIPGVSSTLAFALAYYTST